MLCLCCMFALMMPACAKGDDIVAVINKLDPHVVAVTEKDAKGVEQIVTLGIGFKNTTPEEREDIRFNLLPNLAKLEHLEKLGFGSEMTAGDLKSLPPLPQVKSLGLAQK